MDVFVLTTQWKDGDPEVAGVFSSFEKAVSCFVRTHFKDSKLSGPELYSACARAALKLAGETDDEDSSDFGSTKAWIAGYTVDERSESFEKEGLS